MSVTKEALVIVLDVGASMQKPATNAFDNRSILENAKMCISMILQRKIFSESKDELALILFSSKCTANNLAEQNEGDFPNIEVVQEFKTANWELLDYIGQIEGTSLSSDYVKDNALLVAIDLLQNVANSKKFFTRRILLLTQLEGLFCFDDKVTAICSDLKNSKIELNVIGPSAISDEEAKHENDIQYIAENAVKDYSRDMVKNVLIDVNGESYSFNEAIPRLVYYQKKKVQALPWNANLDIGTQLTIPISGYTKVNESKPKSWKNAYAHKLNAKIEREVSYLLNDENQTKVTRENIVPAYKYGTTLIPFTEEDKANMDYQSGEKGMKVLGFTKVENVKPFHYSGDKSMYIFGQKNRELSGVILAPFIQALEETNMVAIVRYVYSARSAPKMGFLAPRMKENYQCLVFVALPFMEDTRHFIFTPLDADPKNKPTDEQLNAVDELISAMDLSTAVVDENGTLSEALKSKTTVNPYLQRLYQCLQHKALNPEKPLPPVPHHVDSILQPPSKFLKMAEPILDKMKDLFDLKEQVSKKHKREEEEEATNAIKSDIKQEVESARKKRKFSDGGSVSDAINDKITKVGTVRPVLDFQYILKTEAMPFPDACKQIIDVVYKLLENEAQLKYNHSKIMAICKELRHVSLKRNDTSQYNFFMTNLRTELCSCDADLWHKIKNEHVGLISSKEVKSSTVTSSEAENFLNFEPTNMNNEDDNYEDLLDEL